MEIISSTTRNQEDDTPVFVAPNDRSSLPIFKVTKDMIKDGVVQGLGHTDVRAANIEFDGDLGDISMPNLISAGRISSKPGTNLTVGTLVSYGDIIVAGNLTKKSDATNQYSGIASSHGGISVGGNLISEGGVKAENSIFVDGRLESVTEIISTYGHVIGRDGISTQGVLRASGDLRSDRNVYVKEAMEVNGDIMVGGTLTTPKDSMKQPPDRRFFARVFNAIGETLGIKNATKTTAFQSNKNRM
jgi:hypothetical protein